MVVCYTAMEAPLKLFKKPKNRLLPISSPDLAVNGQIWLFYSEKWIFSKTPWYFAYIFLLEAKAESPLAAGVYNFALAIWPVTGQGLQNTK